MHGNAVPGGTPPKYDQWVIDDLAASHMHPGEMNLRMIGNAERAATNTPFSVAGYVIPYYNINGKPAGFYRVRLLDQDPKYRQAKETLNHVYFPLGFLELAKRSDKPYILITEGEKKAALAVKRGYPCVAFGGVDSWRNRQIIIPKESELKDDKKGLKAKVPAGGEISEDHMSSLATGLQDLIDFCLQYNKHMIVVYDTDTSVATRFDVQRAASTFGFEMRFRGVPFKCIRQIHLPLMPGYEKVALDDFLADAPQKAFDDILHKNLARKSAFPRHPNVRDYLNKRLQKARMARKEMQAVSIAVLSELDATGIRLRSSQEQQSYYFDATTHRLLKADFSANPNELTEDPFGHFLSRKFGVGAADAKVLQWLGTQFTGEEPVEEVTPYRVFARRDNNEDAVYLQLSDGQYAKVDGGERGDNVDGVRTPGLRICDNGTDNILFVADQVAGGIDVGKLRAEYAKQYDQSLKNWWAEVLSEVRLRDKGQAHITSLMFYISPWLHRWRGTQLPIEMTLGEAGSGKSTLQELRLQIQTGIPKLRNAPKDIKDWHASIVNSGGLHVIDNLQLPDRLFRSQVSDEICRLITEPKPTIEQRRYYTNAEVVEFPVRCTFGITAISQPFQNADVLQRAFLIELDKYNDAMEGNLRYDSDWSKQKLNARGGREAWLAHHLLVLHKFFEYVRSGLWDPRYQAANRLINFEQALITMAKLFGIPYDYIPRHLNLTMNRSVVAADQTFEGISAFVYYWRNDAAGGGKKNAMGRTEYRKFGASEISMWAEGMQEYCRVELLTNPRKLSRYISTHKTMLAQIVGMVEAGTSNNRQMYKLIDVKS